MSLQAKITTSEFQNRGEKGKVNKMHGLSTKTLTVNVFMYIYKKLRNNFCKEKKKSYLPQHKCKCVFLMTFTPKISMCYLETAKHVCS